MLSGDDALALPPSRSAARGVISVASNEIPAEMTQLVQLLPGGTISPRRARLQRKYLPLMEVNFVESNPIPVKAAMAAMGLLEPVWRLPLCPPKPETMEKIRGVLESLGLRREAGMLREQIEALFDHPPAAIRRRALPRCSRNSRTR